jgi:hypothetical protein
MISLISAAPTRADIDVHGAAAMLEALRAEFAGELGDFPDSAEWLDGTVLAVARRQIRFGNGRVIAEPGDLLLVHRDPCRERVRTLPPVDVAWMPRVLTLAVLREGNADDVVTGAM